MQPFLPFALAFTLAATGTAQTSATFNDPANLRGERPRARTGLELPQDQGAAGLAQMLLRLRTRASLMMIVAHPDDEDGGMLTFEARGHGVRAAMLTLTRGEGGQNLMTGDFNDALGLIRTQELLAADRYFGIDQMFGTEVDFGFSKTREEALAQWTHDRCLYDAVRAVRLYRPLVITSVFTGNPTDGHGHHQVSGQMAQEVFTAAADPTVFPEMLKEGIEPWAPLKVYARVPFAQAGKQPNGQDGIFDYATGKYVPTRFYDYVTKSWSDSIPRADVIIHEGEYSKALGKSYVQFAREGLALQKTQIGAGFRVPPSGAVEVGYTRYGSRVPNQSNSGTQHDEEKSFFDGIDTSLTAIAGLSETGAPELFRTSLKEVETSLDAAIADYDPSKPSSIAPQLARALHEIDSLLSTLPESHFGVPTGKASVLHELRIKRAQLNDALVLALGFRLEAPSTVTDLPADLAASSAVTVSLSAPLAVGSPRIWASDSFAASSTPQPVSQPVTSTQNVQAPCNLPLSWARVTRPYFSRPGIEQAFYDLSTPAFRNAPSTPAPFTCWAEMPFEGTLITVGAVVSRNTQPVSFVPALSVSVSPKVRVLSPGVREFHFETHILPSAESASLSFNAPPGLKLSPPLNSDAPSEREIVARYESGSEHPASLHATVTNAAHRKFTDGFYAVGYPGLVYTNAFVPAVLRVVPVDVQVSPGIRVAYLPGTGDEVQQLLENIGVHATTVSVTDIAGGRLEAFDVLVVGVRAYTAHPDLLVANSHILSFAKSGGTVIVQYQSHAFDHPELAPYPLHLGGDGDKVVEELAKVQLSPSPSNVLTYPNKLSQADFDGWVSERGHGFPASWDAAYEAPTETHDVEQDPQRGGLLIAHYGKGYYVYTAFALYRQLPEAVPGAYRLFANLLSLGRQTSTR